MSLTVKDSRTVKLESLKKAKLAAKQTYDEALLEKLQAADNKIKRSTLRGSYKEALLAYMRTKLGVKRLPKRKEGESYHNLPRWSLIQLLVVDGIKDVRLDHKDLWKIRRGTKNMRPKKASAESAPSSQESVSSSSSSESAMAVVSEPEPEIVVAVVSAEVPEEKPVKARRNRRAAKSE